MIRLTRGLRIALGLCLLALGVFGAGTAQASGSEWMVANNALGTSTKEPLTASLVSTGTLHTKISGTEVDFNCTAGELTNASLEETKVEVEKEKFEHHAKVSAGGKVKFSGCTTKLNGTTQAKCEPVSKAGEKGVIISNEGKGELIKHTTGEGVTVIESITEEVVGGKKQPVFGHVLLAVGCSISEDVPIIGPRLAAVDSSGMTGLLTEAKTHTIKEFAELTKIWALSETAEHVATVSGEVLVELTSHANWSGLLP